MNIERWNLLLELSHELLLGEWQYGPNDLEGGEYVYRLFSNHAKYDPRFIAQGLYTGEANYPAYKEFRQYKAIEQFLDQKLGRPFLVRSFDSAGMAYSWLESYVKALSPLKKVAAVPGFIPQEHFCNELFNKQGAPWDDKCRHYAQMLNRAGRDAEYIGNREEPRSLAFKPDAVVYLSMTPRKQAETGLGAQPSDYQKLNIASVIKRYTDVGGQM